MNAVCLISLQPMPVIITEHEPSSVGHNMEVVVAFSSLARILGECETIHSLSELFSSSSLHQDRSTVAQQAKITVAECSLMSCM